jgi:hypothetical protein
MRVILGFVAVLMAVVASQPALAVCVIRGGATNCTGDGNYHKYPNATQKYETDTPAENPETDGQTAVLQPDGSTRNAWVLTPESTGGATVLNGASAGVLACGSTNGC